MFQGSSPNLLDARDVIWSKIGRRLLKGVLPAKMLLHHWWQALKINLPSMRLSTRRSYGHCLRMTQMTKSMKYRSKSHKTWWTTSSTWKRKTWLWYFSGRKMSLRLRSSNISSKLLRNRSNWNSWVWRPRLMRTRTVLRRFLVRRMPSSFKPLKEMTTWWRKTSTSVSWVK